VTSKTIAILLQTPRDQHSSVFLTYQALSAELVRRGHAVSILTPQDFPIAGRMPGRLTPLAYPLAVARWTRQHGADLDLAVFHSYAGWLALATAPRRRFRAVVAFHGLEPIYHRELVTQAGARVSWRYRLLQEHLMPGFLRAGCRRADLVTCLNAAERDFLVQNGWAPAARVAVVAHGVGDAAFLPIRQARPPRTLLFVGQWLSMKGIDVLRRAFTDLARRHPELALVCAGSLAGSDEVRAAFPVDVRSRVTVLPRVDQRALAEIYRQADIFVFPSHYEGFGLALVEAMAARLPIVTTRIGVAADALKHEESALLIPTRDPNALTRAVERMIEDVALRSSLGENAQRVARKYREADRVREWADALTSIERR
jgi:glycosyltransferase involved in cell wall biosynthesis